MKKLISILVIAIIYSLCSFSVERDTRKILPSFKPTIIERKLMDVNSISAWFRNDGEFFSDHSTTGPGFEWPKGGGVHAIFSSSMWIGARVMDTVKNRTDIRVATVGHFGSELRPGIILEDGTPDDFTKSKYRYYKVRPNEDSHLNPDWLEWPVDLGAPYHDIDGDGTYNPYIDKPALVWGDQIVYPDMLMYTVYNDADPAWHTWIWGRSQPLGAEVRQLSWAYNRSGPFGQMIFMRFEVINKSNNIWDSTYLVVWSDPDMGDAFDDYCGVDTTIFDSTVTSRGVVYEKRNLGYCYNGDAVDGPPGYGSAPPAVGYKYFQGPRIFTDNIEDTAKWSGLRIPKYINLNLSGFNFYCNPGTGGCTNPDWYDPSLFEQSYNIMRGLTRTGKPQVCQGDTVKFIFAGDPVTGTGCLNKEFVAPTDIRFTMPAGPFRMMPGDTQQVVVGVIVARGSSELNSISVLRTYADLSQTLFNNNFRLPPPPPMPKVEYSFVNGNLLITWDKRAESFVNFDPKFDSTTWKFHAYDLYQTNDPLLRPGSKIEKIANWYIKGGRNKVYDWMSVPNVDEPVKMKIWEGGTEGIVNHILLTEDRIGLKPFVPGKPYYFILTATALAEYEETDTTKLKTISGLIVLESPKIPITIVPKNPVQGSEFPTGSNYGDLVPHNRWISKNHYDDVVQVSVVDPWRTENAKYKITFEGVDTNVTGWKLWKVINSTTDSLIHVSNNFSGDDNYPIVSNVLTKVVKQPTGVRRATQQPRGWSYKGRRWFNGAYSPTLIMDEFGTTPSYGLVAYPTLDNFVNKPSGLRPDSLRRVEIRFNKNKTQKAYRYIDGFAVFPPQLRRVKHPEFRPFVKDSVGTGFLYQDYELYRLGIPDSGYVVPFTVWEVDSIHGTERQLDIAIVERNDSLYRKVKVLRPDSTEVDSIIYLNYGNVDGRWSPTHFIYPDTNRPTIPAATQRGDEVLLIFGTTYTDTPKVMYTGGTTETYKPHFNLLKDGVFDQLPIMYAVWMKRLRPDTTFKDGDIFYIRPNYYLNANKVFEFEVKAPIIANSDFARMRNEMNKIKVVPNPYYASHQLQQDPFDSYVTFTNLPARCKIRIFNLAGDMIRTIEHDNMGIIDNSSIRWDLKNHAGIPVASGMYIAHIEAEGIGEKVVKFAIFIQEERLDTF